MKLNKKDFSSYINKYEDDELFYRNLYNFEHDSPEKLKTFLNSYDMEEIQRRKLYVPEIHKNGWSCCLMESSIFRNIPGDIKVAKHYRYSPFYLHQHEFFEILFVYEGQCNMTIGNSPFLLEQGDLCIIPPKTFHGVSIFDDSIAINIMERKSTFQETFFPNFENGNILSHFFSHVLYKKSQGNYMIFKTGQDELIRSMIEDIFIEYLGHMKYSTSILRNMVMLFWGQLLRRHENHIISFCSPDDKKLPIPEIVDYISKHYQNLTLNQTANHFGFNSSYLSFIIKENTGKNFSDIVKEIKLSQACKALKNTQLSIAEICEIIGYNNPEYFMKVFKKEFGLTAGEYRKKYSH